MTKVNNKEINEAADTKEKYNGWTNYETWALHMHITNDADTYDRWTGRAEVLMTHELMDELKESVEYDNYLLFEGEDLSKDAKDMLKDLGSIWRINFHEVAEALKGN